MFIRNRLRVPVFPKWPPTIAPNPYIMRDAAEKGGYRYRYRWWKVNDLEHSEGYNGLQLRALSEHLHDPDFWKALAKARKWEDANAWRFHWHRFIDHLADGKDVESFFAAL